MVSPGSRCVLFVVMVMAINHVAADDFYAAYDEPAVEHSTAAKTDPEITNQMSSTRVPTQPQTSVDHPTTQPPTTTVHPTTTVVQPTTQPPTTTVQSTTQPPTTVQPTTQPPTTVQSTTQPPTTTVQSTTQPPTTTVQSTTQPPTTVQPTTQPPTTTVQPTTQPPTTTVQPTTQPPTTTVQPTTQPPTTTVQPTTQPPTTVVHHTTQPPTIMVDLTTQPLTTVDDPTTQPPTTVVHPTTQPPTTVFHPTTQPPTTVVHHTTQPPTTVVHPATTTADIDYTLLDDDSEGFGDDGSGSGGWTRPAPHTSSDVTEHVRTPEPQTRAMTSSEVLSTTSSSEYEEFDEDGSGEYNGSGQGTLIPSETSEHVTPSHGYTIEADVTSLDDVSTIRDISGSGDSIVTEPSASCVGVTCLLGATCHAGVCVCPPSCPHVVDPVCGSDDVTYMSECDLVAHMCVAGSHMSVIHRGACSSVFPGEGICSGVVCGYGEHCDGGLCTCREVCPDAFDPVCGSNWQTYDSQCHLEAASCTTQSDIRLLYRVACDQVPPLVPIKGVVIGESIDGGPRIHDTYLIAVYAGIGAVSLIALVIIIIVLTTRRRQRRPTNSRHVTFSDDDSAPLTSSNLKSGNRKSSSGSNPLRVTIQERPYEQLDNESLPGSIGHHGNSAKQPPGNVHVANGNAKNGVDGRGIPIRRLLSSTDTSVVEMTPEADVTMQMTSCDAKPTQQVRQGRRMVEPRNMPGRRQTSTTENSVYEMSPDEGATIDMDDVFVQEQLMTRL